MKTKLSQNLKSLLKGKSASWLARESGVPRTTISAWLSGRQAAVNIEQITKVALTLKVPLWRLLNDLDQPDPNESQIPGETLVTLFEGDVRLKISRIEREKK